MKSSAMLFSCLLAASLTLNCLACTDFRLTAKDGTVLITRSMEFGSDLKSHLRTSTRGRAFNTMVNNKPGLNWKATYGYLYLDGVGQDVAIDGMNEAGLSFEALYLPGLAQYQTVSAGKENTALPYMNLGDWILSNFKTVDEVKSALPHINVVTQTIPGMGDMVFPLHFSIYEPSVKGIVIEYIQGNLTISENIGVMTNSPEYAWHVTDLNNFLNLSPYNPKAMTVSGMTFTSSGQGAGAIGLPGDTSPSSRFVKIAFLTTNSYPTNTGDELLNLAEHTINNVDIGLGISRTLSNGKESADYTQWVVFKDLTHKKFYYRTYNNLTPRLIDMNQLDFTASARRLNMDIAGAPYVQNITDQFKQAASVPPTMTAKNNKHSKIT